MSDVIDEMMPDNGQQEAARFTAAIARGATVIVHPSTLEKVRTSHPGIVEGFVATEAVAPDYLLAVVVENRQPMDVVDAARLFQQIVEAAEGISAV